jgi:PAS domain S-box-containing protein
MQIGNTKPDNPNRFSQRFKRAFRRGPQITTDLDRMSGSSASQLLHKLHLYQIELEKQREELQRTKLALDTSRSRYYDLLEYTSTLYNQAPVGYLTLTADGAIVEANLTATKLLNRTRNLLLQCSLKDLIVAEDQEQYLAYYRELVATQQPQRCEVRMERSNGSLFFVQMDGVVMVDMWSVESTAPDRPGAARRDDRYVRITISDVTLRVLLEEEERSVRGQLETTLVDLRQTQEQMIKQERLAVIGQLTAGIAHDFNNILAAIKLYGQIIMRSSDLPDRHVARMETVVAQTDRASHLVQQLLDFSRRTVIARRATALSIYLREFCELLEHTLPETIRIKPALDSLKGGVDDIVDIDGTRIHQVLLNLAFNARDAMPDGGELRIGLSRIVTDETFPPLASGVLAPGSWLQITVSDSGTGIDPKDMPRLFEPFFTTKDIGAGSGLGLAQVWGIVKQHDGEIDVSSQLGRGTTFSIYLPALAEASPTAETPESAAIPHGQGEVVLVVEDNTFLRTALMASLKQLGYQAWEAKNGEDALERMGKEGAEVKLILSDLIMPFVGGEELIRTVRAQGWRQPIIVCSGHPQANAKMEQLQGHGAITWLPKPPTLTQLAQSLYQALHRQAG